MVSKPTGRARGRPSVPLREDRERYILTYYEAQARLQSELAGFSRRGLALALVMFMHGELVDEPENVAAFRNGRPAAIKATLWRGKKDSLEPRHKSAFHPLADDFARKARRYSLSDLQTPDGRWWTAMTMAWMLTLKPQGPEDAGKVQELCDIVGEGSFFARAHIRYFKFYDGLAPEPRFLLPDFNPHDTM